MMASHEASVKYDASAAPLLHMPAITAALGESASRLDAAYYHKAAADGIGFDRTANGSDAVSQHHEPPQVSL